MTWVAPEAFQDPGSSWLPHGVVERKLDIWDTFYKNILNMAKHLTKLPNSSGSIYSRMLPEVPSGHGALEVDCQSFEWTGEGGTGGKHAEAETELPRVLGAFYPPLLLPFLQLYDLSELQVVCSSLARRLTALALTHAHHLTWVLDSCGPPGLLVWGMLPPRCPSMQRWGQTGQDRPWVSTKAWVFTQSPPDTQTIASVHGNLVPGTASPLQ